MQERDAGEGEKRCAAVRPNREEREWERDAETAGVGGFSGDPGYVQNEFPFVCVCVCVFWMRRAVSRNHAGIVAKNLAVILLGC